MSHFKFFVYDSRIKEPCFSVNRTWRLPAKKIFFYLWKKYAQFQTIPMSGIDWISPFIFQLFGPELKLFHSISRDHVFCGLNSKKMSKNWAKSFLIKKVDFSVYSHFRVGDCNNLNTNPAAWRGHLLRGCFLSFSLWLAVEKKFAVRNLREKMVEREVTMVTVP